MFTLPNWKKVANRPFLKFGLPFLITIVGGSFWLRDFAHLRYEYRTQKQLSREQFAEMMDMPLKKKRPTPEQMLEDIDKEVEDNYAMVRGPREYEDQDAVVKKMKEERQKQREAKMKKLLEKTSR